MISIFKKHSLNSNDSSKPVLMCLIDQDVNSAKQFKTLFNNQIWNFVKFGLGLG